VSRVVCELRRCQGRGVCVPVKTCVSVYVCVRLACIGERACACVFMFSFLFAWSYWFVCVCVALIEERACRRACVCARACARSAHERAHAFVREFECVRLVRWEALIAMLACSAERRDATPHRLRKGPLGGG
jgi:hypothetical protein